jgi:putative flippase GtrA
MRMTERVVRYGVSGGSVAVVFSLAVVVLVRFAPAVGPVGASMIAFCLVQPIGYVIHRSISYPDAMGDKFDRRLRFVLTNGAGFVIATGGMAMVTGVFHESYLWGIVLNWALIPAANFMIYLCWVFNVRSWPKGELGKRELI